MLIHPHTNKRYESRRGDAIVDTQLHTWPYKKRDSRRVFEKKNKTKNRWNGSSRSSLISSVSLWCHQQPKQCQHKHLSDVSLHDNSWHKQVVNDYDFLGMDREKHINVIITGMRHSLKITHRLYGGTINQYLYKKK